ncbi:hypothetical protein BROUX41_001261 [Berkeleyomyces rouxiae]|uniref:uncharacterized protein n=1 Tax=Berkeleyomyces rouxiae TaxID=2035830 RepID=UPI003B804BAB
MTSALNISPTNLPVTTPIMPQMSAGYPTIPGTPGKCYGLSPTLYHTYWPNMDCPSINTIEIDGTCGGWKGINVTGKPDSEPLCISFYENSSEWSYLPEVPIPGTYCMGPAACVASPAVKIMLRPQSWRTQLGVRKIKALKLGLHSPWTGSEDPLPADLTGAEIKLEDRDGVLTDRGPSDSLKCGNSVVTTLNFCSDSLFVSSEGKVHGLMQFVYTDCQTQQLLRDSTLAISPALSFPGVELGKDSRSAILTSWIRVACMIEMNRQVNNTKLLPSFQAFDLVATLKGQVMAHEVVGADGSNLKTKMKVCGNISMFDFTWLAKTGSQKEWEWVARFVFRQADLSTLALEYARHCVGSILLDLGGTRDQCYFHGLPYSSRGNALMGWL